MSIVHISTVAIQIGIHPQTIRVYESRGFVCPSRSAGGTRQYCQVDIERLQYIHDLACQGINSAGIRKILELEDEIRRLSQ